MPPAVLARRHVIATVRVALVQKHVMATLPKTQTRNQVIAAIAMLGDHAMARCAAVVRPMVVDLDAVALLKHAADVAMVRLAMARLVVVAPPKVAALDVVARQKVSNAVTDPRVVPAGPIPRPCSLVWIAITMAH